jgi:hypothetical protein
MDRKWMTITAGILDIICGISGIICSIVLIICAIAAGFIMDYIHAQIPQVILVIVFLVAGIPCLILGALAIIGGVFSLRRRNWGIALTGAVASFFLNTLLGIAAIVFAALSRREFYTTT